jgi:hypothetical protein
MYHSMNSLTWFWMTFMIIFWILVLGAVVYLAVRLAHQHEKRPKSDRPASHEGTTDIPL